MAHRDDEMLFHAAAADAHDRGDLALRMAFDPVEPQCALRARWKFGDCLFDNRSFLLAGERFVGGFGGIGAVQRVTLVARPLTQPRPIARHRSLVSAAVVEHQVVGHAEQIGTAIGHRASGRALGLDPQLLDQILGFFRVAAARSKEADQFGPVECE